MAQAIDYRNEIMDLSRELSDRKLQELIDFARFLKAKEEEFTYKDIKDSREYVEKIRINEGERTKSGKRFIQELIEWQKSNY
jgi:hypothetical protein